MKFGKTLTHSGCTDTGANSYECICKEGFEGKICDQETHECEGVNKCDIKLRAKCDEVPKVDGKLGYKCTCREGYYGDGFSCAACTNCEEKAQKGGWKRKPNSQVCETRNLADNICVNVDECTDGKYKHNCAPAPKASCKDTIGSYDCKCNSEYYTKIETKAQKTDEEGEPGHKCYPMTNCGLGMRMVADGYQFQDRICERVLPDGEYAIETSANNVANCLTLWNEQEKVFPERYNWGGLTNELAAVDPLNRPGYVAAADKCQNPICGVCNFNGATSKQNIRLADVARFTIRRVYDDNYLILASRGKAADGKTDLGYRCLGFDRAKGQMIVPYPQLMAWKKSEAQSAKGVCKTSAGVAAAKPVVCSLTSECKAGEVCAKQDEADGSWSIDAPGTSDIDSPYWCGLKSLEDLKAKGNKQTIWNIHALGCTKDTVSTKKATPRWYCKKQKYLNKFLIRSLADMDKASVGGKAQCLYFPKQGLATNPTRVPTTSTFAEGGVWGGVHYKGEAAEPRKSGDHECGIKPNLNMSQEETLIQNKQAVFTFLSLSKDRFHLEI